MRIIAGFTLLTLAAAGCSADSKGAPEPQPSTSGQVSSDTIAYEFIGEVDVAKNEMRIRPALPNEIPSSGGLSTKSWSRISGAGAGSSLYAATYNQTTTPGDLSTVGVTNPYPAGYTCAAGHQCSWVTFTQPSGGTLKFGDVVAVVYNISNGVTLGNGERLPYPAPLYAPTLPANSTYLHYPGGSSWSTFRWDASTTNAFSRPWDFNLNSATAFTFNFQIVGIIDREYSAFTGPTSITTFTDACETGDAFFRYSGGTGRNKGSQAVTLDFPFSLYDSRGIDGPRTVQTFYFDVDGALSVGEELGLEGADDDAASILSTELPGYVILPYYANLTTAKASGQICYASTGTAPFRTAVFTWKDLTYEVDASNSAKATFSALLHEGTDQIDFQYKSVTAPPRSNAATGIKKSASTYQCMLTSAAGCVVDVNAAGVDLNMKQYTIAPNPIGGAPPATVLYSFDFSALALSNGTNSAALRTALGPWVLARSSSATVQTSPSTLVITGIGVDDPRVGDAGFGRGLVLEEGRTNSTPSVDFNYSGAWSTIGSATRTNGQSDPAGGSGAVRIQTTSAGVFGEAGAGGSSSTLVVTSNWVKATSSLQPDGMNLYRSTDTARTFENNYRSTSWQRVALQHSAPSPSSFIQVPVDSRNWTGSGGLAAADHDVVIYAPQKELGARWPSEWIGSEGTSRSGDRLYYPSPSTLFSAGRLGVHLKVIAKASIGGTQDDVNDKRILTIDPNNYVSIDKSTGAVSVVVGSVGYTTPAGFKRARGDVIELWVAFGGGTRATSVFVRTNGGDWTQLSTGMPPIQAALPTPTQLDLLCNGTASQFSGWLQNVFFYPTGAGPTGVIP